ncbi:antibiotic biosynthesis monooxygenase family protein [uncultured Enterovirga sp.]|uniref:antibiotic biosynthesis monooxygenase family protein n=1 Tax=uncultured Enterovirga sp. TaxID=2026352 RepID=UPI0035CCA2FC
MILELATIDVNEHAEAEFEAIVAAARPLFARANGFRSFELRRSVEIPRRYVLLIGWATLEDHTVAFRQSGDCAEWRRLVAPVLARPPVVDHAETVPIA